MSLSSAVVTSLLLGVGVPVMSRSLRWEYEWPIYSCTTSVCILAYLCMCVSAYLLVYVHHVSVRGFVFNIYWMCFGLQINM